MSREIGEIAKAVAQLEGMMEEDMQEEDKKNNRDTINTLLGMMTQLINIKSNEKSSEIEYAKAEIALMRDSLNKGE